MAKHSQNDDRPRVTRSPGAVERTSERASVAPRTPARRTGRLALQLAGLAAVTACAFVTVVAPNIGASSATASFSGEFDEGSVGVQNLEVSASAATALVRDGYTVKDPPPPPPPVIVAAPSPVEKSTSSDSGCPDPNAAVADPATAQAVALELAAARGWTGAQYDALIALWSRESGWRVNALNASSCAYGIPQALPGSKMASAGADWLTNPATQITWGLNYIQGRYGDPASALAHSDANHWY
ncbi:lytic transglycosylase domain-containing protein [Herbiconiux sp. CPCC 205716]|uniref:Lytic transglycosylase domain-containing protein n=1 Tax=Herbiconiux gentiana TaxID=2970912 RepID=A0ABT2GE10_9MICO|nr:lytic transglycosylase domain-containing protein [Herbiconiux gentiana]MCS5714464.1 lytic transglycosylase domain-containing protein [Herbiconiux gentiana]